MTKMTVDPRPESDAVPNSTGIKVVIVGVGLAGITAAIECHRKGHSVVVLEKVSVLKHDGMLLEILVPLDTET